MDYIILDCPHCKEPIVVYIKELNCHIFRHGIHKETLKQIDPHMKKEKCDYLFNNKLIYGCGKPFKAIKKDDKYVAEICEYI
tara:strand:+ start:273 stop:518 length:246 start_codon:yes stop_codon:yes gene_type:complete